MASLGSLTDVGNALEPWMSTGRWPLLCHRSNGSRARARSIKKKEEARRGRHQKNGEEDVNCLDFRWKFAKARLLSVLVPRVSPALLQLVCTRSGFLHIFLCRVSRRLSLPAGSCARDRNTAGAPELSWTDSGGAGVAREGVFGKSFGTSVDGSRLKAYIARFEPPTNNRPSPEPLQKKYLPTRVPVQLWLYGRRNCNRSRMSRGATSCGCLFFSRESATRLRERNYFSMEGCAGGFRYIQSFG